MGGVSRAEFRLTAVDQRQSVWERIRVHTRFWGWTIGSKAILGVIYLAIISEGLRVLIPALGQKVYKLPFLSRLQDYEATCRLDMAPFFAFFLLVGVFVLWPKIIVIWMSQDDPSGWSREEQLIVVIGTAILGADAVLFYYAMTQMTWGSNAFSFPALVSTGAYVGVLVFVSWMSVKLNPNRMEG